MFRNKSNKLTLLAPHNSLVYTLEPIDGEENVLVIAKDGKISAGPGAKKNLDRDFKGDTYVVDGFVYDNNNNRKES